MCVCVCDYFPLFDVICCLYCVVVFLRKTRHVFLLWFYVNQKLNYYKHKQNFMFNFVHYLCWLYSYLS